MESESVNHQYPSLKLFELSDLWEMKMVKQVFALTGQHKKKILIVARRLSQKTCHSLQWKEKLHGKHKKHSKTFKGT